MSRKPALRQTMHQLPKWDARLSAHFAVQEALLCEAGLADLFDDQRNLFPHEDMQLRSGGGRRWGQQNELHQPVRCNSKPFDVSGSLSCELRPHTT